MSEDEDWSPPTESELKVYQARRERSDRISKLMGDYMLKGYKMLSTCCAVCDTILLQDKHGVNYCVACQELDSDNMKDDPALSSEAALRQAAEQRQKSSTSSKTSSPTEPEAVGSLASLSPSHTPSGSGGQEGQQAARAATVKTERRSGSDSDEPGQEDCFTAMSRNTSSRQEKPSSEPRLRSVSSGPPGAAGVCMFHSQSPIQETSCVGGRPRTRAPEGARHTSHRVAMPHSKSLPHMTTSTDSRCFLEHGHTTVTQALEALFTKLHKATTELQQSRDVRHCTDLCLLIKSCAEAATALKALDIPNAT